MSGIRGERVVYAGTLFILSLPDDGEGRYMPQKMNIIEEILNMKGHPSVFVTKTGNSNKAEIRAALLSRQSSQQRPDVQTLQ